MGDAYSGIDIPCKIIKMESIIEPLCYAGNLLEDG